MSNSKIITGSINLSKVDKSRLYEGKNGDKYLNLVMWLNDEPDNYGNHMSIQQSISQKEKEAGVKAQYIGNGKVFEKGAKQAMPKSNEFDDGSDGLPF